MKHLWLLALTSVLFSVQTARCQAVGTISGKVTDSETGQTLPGANVLVKGTSVGASTDLHGRFSIPNAPAGQDTLKVSYVGYDLKQVPVGVGEGESVTLDVKLIAVGVRSKGVTVTAQASGQNAAINQELSSDNVVNVVSAARIHELPDANAAESVGRLPGVFLVRSYGEGSQVAIRGLEPKYNQIEIDGVEMPSNSSSNRSVDMSMISSYMLSGIELFKTVTPDMDAAVLGGTVNFKIREARSTPSGAPIIQLETQGGYNNLQNTLGDYEFSGSVEKRFFDNRFGVFAQALTQRQNLTADIFGGSYGLLNSYDYYNPHPTVIMNSLNLTYKPTEKNLYDGTLVLDYRWSSGKVDLMNFLSQGRQITKTFNQSYGLSGNSTNYSGAYFAPIANVIMNILDYKQHVLSFTMDARVSHAYSENVNPGYWSVNFSQLASGIGSLPLSQSPEAIAQQASAKTDLNETFLTTISTNTSFTRQRNLSGSIDFQRSFNFSDFLTATLKFGGAYRHTFRSYTYSSGSGTYNIPGGNAARSQIIAADPWLAQPPYNLNPNGDDLFLMPLFFDQSSSFGKFLGGDYLLSGYPTNLSVLSKIVNTTVALQNQQSFAAVSGAYVPDEYGNIASNYLGYEDEEAAYVMATINFGPRITLIPGVRYQGLRTRYTAAYVPTAYDNNTFPFSFPYTDSTSTQYHGYWLPDVSLRYKPFDWFDIRLAYTNTLTYPDFNRITPAIDIFVRSVNWNNQALKPGRSQNYDIAMSFYNNSLGLLTIDPFLKQIDDLIFPYGDAVYITNPSQYGFPDYMKGYALGNLVINDPYRVNLWGIEANWQTHFWYLPFGLSGLVLNVNYTHIFSGAKYPFQLTEKKGGYPHTTIVYVDTFYTDRLIDQPSNIVNLSVGYDYKGFSARVSWIYQENVFSQNNFWPSLRQRRATYSRLDFSAMQNLPWYGLQAYLDINNLNGEPDITVIQGTGFPNSDESYGLSADVGLRWNFAQ